MDLAELARSLRASLTWRTVTVMLGVSGTMGVVEWLGLGHPAGLAFGLGMGIAALTIAPLPWLALLPWGLRRPLWEVAARAAGVLAASAIVVVIGFAIYFAVVDAVKPVREPLVCGAVPHLAAWSSIAVSVPLFAAAGWGLSRHLELARRLEVRDVREVALRSALEEARHLALRSRLDPHFLFNGLNLIVELIREDPAEAERCVLRLSSLLRAALEQGERPLVPLGRELDLCADYLELARARFGDRLAVSLERDPAAESAAVPPLAVQVLCDNAVRHGIEHSPGGGEIRLETHAGAATVEVKVASPGDFRGEREGGVGLAVTRRRLALAFGDRARLEVGPAPGGGATLAVLTLPRGAS